jgi:hypothetical protein
MKYNLIWVALFAACGLVHSADESPSTHADAVTLASRVADLEARVAKLEAAQPKPVTVAAKPVLEIHTESWCAPCRVLKADLEAAGELPVEIRYSKFSGTIPALRWTDASGKQVTRTGYSRGSLQAIISEVTAASVARKAASIETLHGGEITWQTR